MLARDLDEVIKLTNDSDIEKLCHLIKENYKYPVDTVLISSELSVISHINVHQTEAIMPNGYFSFLKKGLAKIGVQIDAQNTQEPGNADITPQEPLGSDKPLDVEATPKSPVGLKLTRKQPKGSMLEVVNNNGNAPGMAMYPIDVDDFADGGTVEINIRLGGGGASVQCELCVPDSQNPQFFVTLQTIPGIVPGKTKVITHKFEKEQKLMLVVKAMPGPKGQSQANALLATVAIKTDD